MAKHTLRRLESDVAGSVDRLVGALLDRPPGVVIGMVRRLPRILDIFVPDGEPRARLDQLLRYSSILDLFPNIFQGQRVAIVDDCVQRGSRLADLRARLTGVASEVRVHALARSHWHVQQGLFGGGEIQEPVLDLDPEDFGLFTAFLNARIEESPIPLDCDDEVLEVRSFPTVRHEALIDALSRLAPLHALPPTGSIRRFSHFLDPANPLVADLIGPICGYPIVADGEAKLLWTFAASGPVHLVPFLSNTWKAPHETREMPSADMPEPIQRFAALFVTSPSRRRAIAEAFHLYAGSTLAGRLVRMLAELGSRITLTPRADEFDRRYGSAVGTRALALFERSMTVASEQAFNTGRPPRPELRALTHTRYHELATRIRHVLDEHYCRVNAEIAPAQWEPAGLSFGELAGKLAQSDVSTDGGELSAVLDGQLATCWLRAPLAFRAESVVVEYQRTEQFLTLDPPPILIQRRDPRRPISFARSSEWLAVHEARLVLVSAQEALRRFVPEWRLSHEFPWAEFVAAVGAITAELHRRGVRIALVRLTDPPDLQVAEYLPYSNAFPQDFGTREVLGMRLLPTSAAPETVSLNTDPSAVAASRADFAFVLELAARRVGAALSRYLEIGLPAKLALILVEREIRTDAASAAPENFTINERELINFTDILPLKMVDRKGIEETSATVASRVGTEPSVVVFQVRDPKELDEILQYLWTQRTTIWHQMLGYGCIRSTPDAEDILRKQGYTLERVDPVAVLRDEKGCAAYLASIEAYLGKRYELKRSGVTRPE